MYVCITEDVQLEVQESGAMSRIITLLRIVKIRSARLVGLLNEWPSQNCKEH